MHLWPTGFIFAVPHIIRREIEHRHAGQIGRHQRKHLPRCRAAAKVKTDAERGGRVLDQGPDLRRIDPFGHEGLNDFQHFLCLIEAIILLRDQVGRARSQVPFGDMNLKIGIDLLPGVLNLIHVEIARMFGLWPARIDMGNHPVDRIQHRRVVKLCQNNQVVHFGPVDAAIGRQVQPVGGIQIRDHLRVGLPLIGFIQRGKVEIGPLLNKDVDLICLRIQGKQRLQFGVDDGSHLGGDAAIFDRVHPA